MSFAGAATLQPGDRVGRYEIVRHLATGGMAELYIARASGLEGVEQVVALKRVLAQFADDPMFVQMFLDEARIAATLQHHGVAQVLEFGRDGDTYYYTMELLRGHDLHKVSRTIARGQIEVDFAAAVAIGMSVASALHYVHDRRDLTTGQPLGLVHRDISPSNIIVTYDGGVKILDFGIAKSVVQRARTRANAIKGKIPYMSPEQCRGLVVDRRSDVYALGTVLYEITTGQRAFFAETEKATIELILDGRIRAVESLTPSYPPALAHCIRRAMAIDPADRYETALDLAIALEDVATSSRYLTSSVALGAWLRRGFGPPDDLVLPASSAVVTPPASLAAAATTSELKPVLPETLITEPPRRRSERAATMFAPEQSRNRWPWLLAATACIAGSIAVGLLVARTRHEQKLAKPLPAVMPAALGSRLWPLAAPAPLDKELAAPPPIAAEHPKRSARKNRRVQQQPRSETWRDSPFLPGVD